MPSCGSHDGGLAHRFGTGVLFIVAPRIIVVSFKVSLDRVIRADPILADLPGSALSACFKHYDPSGNKRRLMVLAEPFFVDPLATPSREKMDIAAATDSVDIQW